MSTQLAYELRPLPDGRSRKVRDRFWTRVDRSPGQGPKGECWTWTGSRDNTVVNGRAYDYGRLGFKWDDGSTRPIGAHVCAFYLTRGRLPEKGMQICHTCDNPPCVNPAHLFEGTAQDNMVDAQLKGRKAIAAPKPVGVPRETRIRLTPEQCGLIRDARKGAGLNIYEVAAGVGFDYTHYHRLESGERPIVPRDRLAVLMNMLGIHFQISDSQLCSPRRYKPAAPTFIDRLIDDVKMFRPLKSWLKLSPVLDYYRADVLIERAQKRNPRLCQAAKESGVGYYDFKDVLSGLSIDHKQIMRVASYVGLSESEVFNIKRAEAA